MSDDAMASGDGAEPVEAGIEPETGLPTESKLFYGFGVFSIILGVIYLVWTGMSPDGVEWAGGIALLFAAGFAIFFATFMAISLRRVQRDVVILEENADAGLDDPDQTLYLPDTSLWPIGIGVGASLALAGVALGFWVMIPGIVLFAHSIIGFAHQSRRRR